MKKTNGMVLGVVLCFAALARTGLADNGLSKFGVKLKMGAGLSGDGDLRSFISGFDDFANDISAVWGLRKSGEFRWTRVYQAFGGEVMYQAAPRFSLGLGVELMTKSRQSRAELGPDPYLTGSVDSHLKVVPVTLTAYYDLPLTQGTRAYIKGGIGRYWGRISYVTENQHEGMTQRTSGDIKASTFGCHVGAGLQVRISKNIALFSEASGRLVKFSGWTGDESESLGGKLESVKGAPVWSIQELYGSNTARYYPSVYYGEKPGPTSRVRSARPFSVSFSGIALEVGLKIGFGK